MPHQSNPNGDVVASGRVSANEIPGSAPRAVGALLGLAVGDALGTTVEFQTPGTFAPVTDITGGGPFNLAPGQWTDDTSMAMCLGESLLACGGFNAHDQMTRYVRWWREGHWSSTGRCFDIGNTVRESLGAFARGEPAPWGPTRDDSAGNGSLMRLAPVALYWHHDARTAIAMAAESSRTTHGETTAVDACRYACALIVGALRGAGKSALLAPLYAPEPGIWDEAPLHPAIESIARGSYKSKSPPHIRGTGHVVPSLEAALWAFHTTTDFRSGALAAVNLGNDADTTGAIYGQFAGAFYGVEGIPRAWRECVTRSRDIAQMAELLVAPPLRNTE